MTLEHLLYFLEICNVGTVTGAAENLHVSPQAISKAIKRLEEEYETAFFIRNKDGMFLTELGKEFKLSAETIVAELKNFSQKVYQQKSSSNSILNQKESISVLCTTTFSSLLNIFYQQLLHQHSYVSLSSFTTDPMIVDLPDNFHKYDIAVFCIPSQFDFVENLKDTHNIYLLDSSNLRLFLSKKSPFADNKIISNRTLSQVPIVDFSINNEDSLLVSLLKQHGINPYVYIRSNTSIHFIDNKAPDNYCFLGTKFLVEKFMRNAPKDLISIPLRTKISLSYIFTVKKESLSSPAVNDFYNMMMQYFKHNAIKIS